MANKTTPPPEDYRPARTRRRNVVPIPGISRALKKHTTVDPCPDERRKRMFDAAVPRALQDLTLADHYPKLMKETLPVAMNSKMVSGPPPGITLIPHADLTPIEFRNIWLVYLRDIVLQTAGDMRQMPMLVNLRSLKDAAERGKGSSSNLYAPLVHDLENRPTILFIDRFYDAEVSRAFPESKEDKRDLTAFIYDAVDDGVKLFPLCYPSMDKLTNWYPVHLVELIERVTLPYTLE